MNKIVILLISVALGVSAMGVYALDAGLMGPAASTITTATTVTESVGASSNPMPGCVMAKVVSSKGYSVEVYLPSSPKIGDKVCIDLIVRNVGSDPSASPNVQRITQQMTITDSSGRVVTTWNPVVLATGTLQPGHYIEAGEYWDSHAAYDGITPQAGTFHLHLDIKVPQSGPSASVELTSDTDLTITN
jgi:hypothetical protein